jgi:Na+-translocating ferredoxin:NAD+ oxidoreductase RNF subunit RnfB
MISFLSAVLAMSGLGIVLSLVLGLAAKVFYVYTDPRTETIMDILPGANCGGCGYAGCGEYAEAIVEKGESPNKCVAAGPDVTEQVCCVLGVEATIGERKVAKIFCQGDQEKAWKRFEYAGADDCYAAIVSTGGDKACQYGCVGLGTCVKACPFDALSMGENGLPIVNIDLCTGCGCCLNACPRNLPRLIPISQPTANLCSTHDSGKVVKSVCSVGCISCSMCLKKCPEGAVVMQDKMPVVLPERCKGHKICVEKCPTGSMRDLQASQETEQAAAQQS